MVAILIQGDGASGVAEEMRAAFREIFEIEPLLSARGGGGAAGTRTSLEPFILALAIPPAVVYTQNLAKQLDLSGRWNRLLSRTGTLSKDKDAAILIDTGHGKPIPLHLANRDQIMAALKAVETQLKL